MVTNTIAAIRSRCAGRSRVPVDRWNRSETTSSFGITLSLLREAQDAALAACKRGTLGDNVMYFETGQGSSLSANAHLGVDQQTCEARAYAVAREFHPLLVNTVVGFIGPEYLFDGKQIVRAGLEDHFCGKLLGLPMGCDICYTNHSEADQNDMDTLLTLLGVAGVNFIMGVPGADDIMLNYQSTSLSRCASMPGVFSASSALRNLKSGWSRWASPMRAESCLPIGATRLLGVGLLAAAGDLLQVS